jgi:pimeloyl-ACP methyl ester carboxylesterase
MVHGNPSWSLYYRRVVKALRPRYRCVVPDHIGCGLSDKPDDGHYTYTLGSRIDDLTSLMDATIPTGQIDLIVHDWGGAIGFGWAVKNPDRIRRLVVLNTAAFRNPAGQSLPKPLWLVRNTPLGPMLVRGMNAFSVGATRMAVINRMSARLRRAYTAPYNNWKNRIATLRFVEDIPLKESDPAWAPLVETETGLTTLENKPMLICWGDQDFVFDEKFLAEWQRRFPQASVHRFAGAGHYVLEDAGDDIVPKIEAFLDAP